MYRMKSKVKIISRQKSDGRFNFGVIVGIELIQDAYYLGYKTEKEFVSKFIVPKYKVAYVDCFTNKAHSEWFAESELSKNI